MLRLKGKPFEILAVSLDDTREELVEVVRQKKVPGLQTWDKAGWNNPLSTLYNIQTIPTWYLIDSQGVIRGRDPFGEKLVPAVEALLAPPHRASEAKRSLNK